MDLYYSPGACSMAPHIALSELEIKYNLSKLNLKEGEQKKPEYLKVNPKGYVPALRLDNGEVLTEAPVILQYLADQKPEKKLIPAMNTKERYKAMEWLNFVTTEMHKGFGGYFALPRLSESTAKEVRGFWDGRMKERMNYVSDHLSKNQFFMGDTFTVVDIYAFTVLNWHKMIQFDLSPWPSILGFMERVGSRPSVQAALQEEGLTGPK